MKNNAVKTEEKVKLESSSTNKKDTSSPPLPSRKDPAVPVKTEEGQQATTNAESTAQPLAPPPRPTQEGGTEATATSADYFSGSHKTSHYSLEPNLFEQSFGKPPDTPGKSILPPVASLTSPSLTGNGYDWTGSLRSGPLSPAMLSGPTGGDYFDSSLRASFPTPNESSLRTGLTPGGSGSMFPAPSPNSQALFQSLANGGATPGTLEFHRTAISAKAANKSEQSSRPTTTTAARTDTMNATAPPATTAAAAAAATTAAATAGLGHHDNEAANGLYLLAQAGNESQSNNNQFAVPNQPGGNHIAAAAQEKSSKRTHNATASIGSGSAHNDTGDASDVDSKPSAKKQKKGAATNGKGGKGKKIEETPTKPAKKTKSVASTNDPEDDSDDDEDLDQHDSNGRKMTDEEKRKNFLERNRVAALKCRQRKKQWLANLQAKVEIFSSENDALNAQVNSLREEILNLKTILIAHKDCPIAQQQQVGQYMPQHQPEYAQPNPYGMQMQQGQAVMAGPRRYS